jgi:hypothetical protein
MQCPQKFSRVTALIEHGHHTGEVGLSSLATPHYGGVSRWSVAGTHLWIHLFDGFSRSRLGILGVAWVHGWRVYRANAVTAMWDLTTT